MPAMRYSSVLFAAATAYAAATPSYSPTIVPSAYTAGIQNATITSSSNGTAACINGFIDVQASTTMNKHLNLALPANQSVVTEGFVEMLQAGSTQAKMVVGANATVSGTYSISVQLCYPRASGINPGAVQILTHGIGFDKSYWDVAPGFSYIDVATAAGYTTFSYDRLGVGLSAKPGAIQVVQAPLEVGIKHSLIQLLRTGKIGSTTFSKVVGVGHSFGSIISQAITVMYPTDLDAAVLTGFTLSETGMPTFLTSLDLTIAALNDPVRFYGLSTGYLIANNYIGNQFAFLRSPGFPPSNLAIAESTKQTVTLGELYTLSGVTQMTNYTGPVTVVNGANDWPFCQGNCSYPNNLSAAVSSLYPKTKAFGKYVAPLAGHGLNLHYTATAAFNYIQGFLKTNL